LPLQLANELNADAQEAKGMGVLKQGRTEAPKDRPMGYLSLTAPGSILEGMPV